MKTMAQRPYWLRSPRIIEGLLWLPEALARHLLRHGVTWLLLVLSYVLFNENYVFGINSSPSLPNLFFLTHKNEPVAKGDMVSFYFKGQPTRGKAKVFTKVVAGVPGDVVTRKGRDLFINGQFMGAAKEESRAGHPLAYNPIPEGGYVIKNGEFYVWAPHMDSLDSRYEMVGFVQSTKVIGRAYPVL